MAFCFVFFTGPGDHRDLHSFPTRRSSDLLPSPVENCDFVTSTTHKTLAGPRASCRSEEHTSELQSRQYLVCRLLLEKKNKIEVRSPRQIYPYAVGSTICDVRATRFDGTTP